MTTTLPISTERAPHFRLPSAHRHLGDLLRSTFVRRVLQLPSGEKDNRAVLDFLRESNLEDKLLPLRWIIQKVQTVTRQMTNGVAFIILENNARSLRRGEQFCWRASLPRREWLCILSVATNKVKRVSCRNKQRNPRISAFADEIIVTLPLCLGLGVQHLGRCHRVAPYRGGLVLRC